MNMAPGQASRPGPGDTLEHDFKAIFLLIAQAQSKAPYLNPDFLRMVTLADYRVQLVTILFEDIIEFMLITMAPHLHIVTMQVGGSVNLSRFTWIWNNADI